jgi:hypothetical protein
MRGRTLQNVVQRGLGRAALMVGQDCHAYRPNSVDRPLTEENRYLRLQAAFIRPGRSAVRAMDYGQAVWEGIFDAAYTRPGDYLVRVADGAVWFIAGQPELEPIMCVQAERVVAFSRPAISATAAAYGGVVAATAIPLLAQWPASVLDGGGGGIGQAGLPGDPRGGNWRVLLPALPGVLLRGGDLMSDDLGRNGVVATAELTALGWRLTVRQATS